LDLEYIFRVYCLIPRRWSRTIHKKQSKTNMKHAHARSVSNRFPLYNTPRSGDRLRLRRVVLISKHRCNKHQAVMLAPPHGPRPAPALTAPPVPVPCPPPPAPPPASARRPAAVPVPPPAHATTTTPPRHPAPR
jgi:hypothetical protein